MERQEWTGSTPLPTGHNVRQSLALLRQRWERHSPVTPLCMAEELVEGLTVSEFCVGFLLMQRTRRGSASTVRSSTAEPPEQDGPATEILEASRVPEAGCRKSRQSKRRETRLAAAPSAVV